MTGDSTRTFILVHLPRPTKKMSCRGFSRFPPLGFSCRSRAAPELPECARAESDGPLHERRKPDAKRVCYCVLCPKGTYFRKSDVEESWRFWFRKAGVPLRLEFPPHQMKRMDGSENSASAYPARTPENTRKREFEPMVALCGNRRVTCVARGGRERGPGAPVRGTPPLLGARGIRSRHDATPEQTLKSAICG